MHIIDSLDRHGGYIAQRRERSFPAEMLEQTVVISRDFFAAFTTRQFMTR
ncbi:hypothetical protein NYE76_28230 [Paenibacillus sp. FSL M7-0831]